MDPPVPRRAGNADRAVIVADTLRVPSAFGCLASCASAHGSVLATTPLRQLIQAAAGRAELALPGKFLPNGRRILVRGRNGHNARRPAAAHRPHADPRLIVETSQFQPLLERLQSGFELLRTWRRLRRRIGLCSWDTLQEWSGCVGRPLWPSGIGSARSCGAKPASGIPPVIHPSFPIAHSSGTGRTLPSRSTTASVTCPTAKHSSPRNSS